MSNKAKTRPKKYSVFRLKIGDKIIAQKDGRTDGRTDSTDRRKEGKNARRT